MSSFNGIEVPAGGQKITVEGGHLKVPSNPIIPFKLSSIEISGVVEGVGSQNLPAITVSVDSSLGL